MELDNTIQVKFNELTSQKFDLFIALNSYETRCVFLPQRITSLNIKRKIVLSFADKKENGVQELNTRIFEQLGFEKIEAARTSINEIKEILDNLCASAGHQELNILVDYCSMPKLWYGAIINYFMELEEELNTVNVWFSYTPSEYTQAPKNITNKFMEPVNLTSSTKPKALILGLGYEKNRAEELADKMDAQVTYSFYSDPAVDPRFVEELLHNNKNILKNLDHSKVVKYPIFDLNYINSSLTSLCVDLRLSHQIILAPLGPKPFTLMCFLLSARYPDINIWRISSEPIKDPYDRKPFGDILVYKVLFTSEGVDYDD